MGQRDLALRLFAELRIFETVTTTEAAVEDVEKLKSQLRNICMRELVITLEKEMATHSSTLSWKIPWTEEPGRLQSMGSQRIGHD